MCIYKCINVIKIILVTKFENRSKPPQEILVEVIPMCLKYVGHLESKERLRIKPAKLFILADESCDVFSRVWTVAWCSSCCKHFHVVSVIG